MRSLLLGRRTLVLFLLMAIACIVGPVLLNINRVGSSSTGFPIEFSHCTSAPPPAFGCTTSWVLFLVNVVIYYLAAVGLSYVTSKLSKKSA